MPRAKLAGLSVLDLQKEIARRCTALPGLIEKRDCLNCRIAELESLGSAPAAARKRGRKRGARKAAAAPKAPQVSSGTSLRQVMIDVMKGRGTMTVPEIVDGVLAAGYQSKAKTFRLMVNQMLSKSGGFRRVRRGRYVVKG